MTITLHWFRRDLRVDDNTALIAACQNSAQVTPLFIFDDTLLKTDRGGGGVRVGFMLDCLRALDQKLRGRGSQLVIRRGDPLTVLQNLIAQTGATRLTYNRDYSPYARQRDSKVVTTLRAEGITVEPYQDLVLHEFKEILTNGEKPYQVFTPYFKRWSDLPKPTPQTLNGRFPPLPDGLDAGAMPDLDLPRLPNPITQAGEAVAFKLLDDFTIRRQGGFNPLHHYHTARNMLAEDGTSRLSPHLRWGTISIRRCYAAADLSNEGGQTWVSELAWRDFYQMVLAYHPQVLTESFRPKYDQIKWANNADWFAAWCEGKTGYPVVDAAMRQLNHTGWMHNRARMIVASFLCKDLLIDWRWGERYFMQHLLDGDTAANNGGWQWAAGTGTDAAPYFRIFNPTSQGEKYDPDGEYVRRWIPELRDVPTQYIHQPSKMPHPPANYPAPIVDHKQQRQCALEMYSVVKASDS